MRQVLYSSNTINILRSKPMSVDEAPKCLLVCFLSVSCLLLNSSISITLNKSYLAGDMSHEKSEPHYFCAFRELNRRKHKSGFR